MLLRTTLLCLFSAGLVVSQSPLPEVIADYDPFAALEPMNTGVDDKNSTDLNVREIRGLLGVRHNECSAGFGECANKPGKLVRQFASTSLAAFHTRVFGRGHLFSVSRDGCV